VPEPRERPFDLGLKTGGQQAALPGSSSLMSLSSSGQKDQAHAPAKMPKFGHAPGAGALGGGVY
jgi:hypothetical protein